MVKITFNSAASISCGRLVQILKLHHLLLLLLILNCIPIASIVFERTHSVKISNIVILGNGNNGCRLSSILSNTSTLNIKFMDV